MKFLFISAIFFLNISYNCNNCCVNFHEVGLKDYSLGIVFNKLNSSEDLIFERNSKVDSLIKVYSIKKKHNILGKEKEVTYYFAIKNDLLESYVFKIPIGSELNFYKKFIEEVKNKNTFIKEYRASFLSVNGNCKRFLRLQHGLQLAISGGANRLGYDW